MCLLVAWLSRTCIMQNSRLPKVNFKVICQGQGHISDKMSNCKVMCHGAKQNPCSPPNSRRVVNYCVHYWECAILWRHKWMTWYDLDPRNKKSISLVLIFVIVVGFNAFLALSHIIAVVSNRYHGSFQWVPKHGPDLTFVTLFDLEDIDQGQWNLSRVKIMWTPINPQRDVVLALLDSEISAGHFRTAPSNGRLRQVPHHYMC